MLRQFASESPPGHRRGTVLPLFALCVVSLFGFIAMAIDLGMLAVARTECQNAADSAALAGARALNNVEGENSNLNVARAEAEDAPTRNVLFNANFTAGDVDSVEFGLYRYDATAEQFIPDFNATPGPGESYTATRVKVSGNKPAYFSRIFGVNDMQTQARAIAVHRPRDIAMVIDMTGSMRFGSVMRVNGSYLSADPSYPMFGHYTRYPAYQANYAGVSSTAASDPAARNNPFFTTTPYVRTDTREVYAPNNYSVPTAGGPACVKDFFFDPANLANPASPVASPSASLVSSGNTTMRRAFHHWDPTVASAGNPDNYIAPTYGFGGWNGTKDVNGFVFYPTPYAFENQSDANYLGDRHPRKRGKEAGTGAVALTTSWNPLTADGAAVNLAEYLGWMSPITSGGLTPRPDSSTNRPTIPSVAPGRTADWTNFRDATWEKHGYDLDVPKYITDRGSRDPRTPMANPTLRTAKFKGYSMGPGYWGKTFFQWPPDPRFGTETATGTDSVANPRAISTTNPVQDSSGRWICDWRRRFFHKPDGSRFHPEQDADPAAGGANDTINEIMMGGASNAGDVMNFINGSANKVRIDYEAVLKWIKSPPMAFPPNLRAGRVVYYTSIPDNVDGTSLDQAFWRQYIDYVIRPGDDHNQGRNDSAGLNGFELRGWPEAATAEVGTIDLTGYDPDGGGPLPRDPKPYMHYLDNPNRPRSQMWFGPLSMMGFLAYGKGNTWAGTVHESQTWQLKAGMNSVLDDIRKNHPNDCVGLAYFSRAAYGRVSVALGQDWQPLKDALFYPQTMIDRGNAFTPTEEFDAYSTVNNGTDIRSRAGSQIPNAQGGTDPNTGLGMAFNILSPSTQSGIRGPTSRPVPYFKLSRPQPGRRGASKIVIFETDGVPNGYSNLSPASGGGATYYKVDRLDGGGAGNGDPIAIGRAVGVVNQVVLPLNSGGLSSDTSPARVYSIGFGDLFSSNSNTEVAARKFLLDIQKAGKTSESTATAIPPEQIITGSAEVRIDSLRTCLERIMQSGVQVTLIE